ncbi:MAG TPA: hypothetical protein DCY07_07410 [Rhodospirillaceae bacterium]|nr:hypothetical protein [Rhodospirillaceae bacterium]
MTDSQNLESPLMKAVLPVWHNVYWAKAVIQMYEAIAACASEVNEAKRGLFFGTVQRLAINDAVITLCKLYDASNKYSDKHALPDLHKVFASTFSPHHAPLLSEERLIALGIQKEKVTNLLTSLSSPDAFDPTKARLLRLLECARPSEGSSSSLKKIFDYRNKIGAHQEQLTAEAKNKLRLLPSIDEMDELWLWADNFCKFVVSTLGGYVLHPSGRSTKTATLNVVAKILDIDGAENYLAFMKEKSKQP